MTLHLDDAEVRRLLPLEPLIGAVREALIDLSAGHVVQPLRTVIEIASEDGLLQIEATPGKTAEEAVRGADIVCTITNVREPVLMGP